MRAAFLPVAVAMLGGGLGVGMETAIASDAPALPSTPDLGQAEGRCRPHEPGPALIVSVEGLKDRQGVLKLEVYPANDHDFLEDDNKLIMAGKTFRRVVKAVPVSGPVHLCVRLPAPGIYSVSLLHDRNDNHRFDLSKDGVGFTGNPRLGLSKPKAEKASVIAGPGLTDTTIILNYRRGLFSFGPIKR